MVKILAHRGASGYAPENTISAFKLAEKLKADGIELDVQLTKDGEMVVIHDEKINRTSDGSGFVKDYTLKELKKLNFNASFKNYKFEEIPTLEEVFNLYKNNNMIINAELKTSLIQYPGIEEKILKLAQQAGMENRIIYSSFNHFSIKKIKELNSDAVTGMLFSDGIVNITDYASSLKVSYLHPATYSLYYENFIENALAAGLKLNVWSYSAEDDIDFINSNKDLLNSGKINALITNFPDKALSALIKNQIFK